MCGFAGVLQKTGTQVNPSVMATMKALLYHRGPDDAAEVYIDTTTGFNSIHHQQEIATNLALGFQRLSIIDRSLQGRQPMTNHDQSLWLVFNGEIYNAPELKAQLRHHSRRFISQSDTEVILALYEERGLAAFECLNGMYAIALWDQNKHQLILARDRLGIKPLYYARAGETLLFSSEIKALLSYPGIDKTLNVASVLEYFSFQYCLQEKTLFSAIHLVEPGSIMVFADAAPNQIAKKQHFWKFHYHIDDKPSIEDYADRLKNTLSQAIQRQVRSDVTVGAFLSSGMDTGSICALASRHIDTLNTFTCGFNVQGMTGMEHYFDERQEAKSLSDRLGGQHHTIALNWQHMQALLPKVMWHLEDPRVGISYQIMAMAEAVKQHCTVVLSGTGGDELFAGYHWRYAHIMHCQNITEFNQAYYQQACRLIADGQRWNFFNERIKKHAAGFTPQQSFNALMADCNAEDPLHRALYFDAKGFLQGLLLVDDKLNMAHSVEPRVPLLDNELIDLALSMPAAMKYDGHTTKKVLKKALSGILPQAVITRRKQGFTPPDATWFRSYSRSYIHDLLLSERFLDRGWFKQTAVQRILTEHDQGQYNHRFLIWSLLSFEWLHRLLIENSMQCEPNEMLCN